MSDNVDTSPLGIERTERIAGDAAVNNKLDIVATELQNTQTSVTAEVMHRSEGDLVVQRILEGYIQDLLDGKADDFERYIEFQNSQNLNYEDVRNFVSGIRTSLAEEIRNLTDTLMNNLRDNDVRYNKLVSDVDRYVEILSDVTLDSNQITLDDGELRAGAWTILSQARQWDLDIINRLNGLSASVGDSLKDAVEEIQNQLPSTEETITKAIEELSKSPQIKELSDALSSAIEDVTSLDVALLQEQANRQRELSELAVQQAQALADEKTLLLERLTTESQDRVDALQREAAIRQQMLLDEAEVRQQELLAEAETRQQALLDEAEIRQQALLNEAAERSAAVSAEVAARKASIDELAEDMLTRADQDKADYQSGMLTVTNRIKSAEDGLTSEIQYRKDGDTSNLNALNTYKVSNDSAITGLNTSLSNNVTKTNANTTLITGLTARMTTAESDIESVTTATADAMTKATTAVSANSALATRVDALAAAITESEGTTVDVNAFNALKAEVTTVQGVVTGLTEDVTTLESNYTSVNSKVNSHGTSISTLNNKMTAAENSISQSANDITLLKTDISTINSGLLTKVDSQAFSQLSSDVSELDGKYTTQAGLVTDLRGSLDTTNVNVGNAATAAQNAMNAAGAKGKVIFGTSAPAAADRLSQNLWIDTTGNANTPKRWNGSAWIVVTDKVATDALAAANAATTLAHTKADTSAFNTLDQKVTVMDGKVSTNTNSITSLNGQISIVEGALATKLDSSAISNYYTKQQTDDKASEIAAGKVEEFKSSISPILIDEFLTNGSFNSLDSWVQSGGVTQHEFDTVEGYKNPGSVKTSSLCAGFRIASKDVVQLVAGKQYKIELWYKTSPSYSKMSGITLGLVSSIDSAAWLPGSSVVSWDNPSETWKKVTREFTAAATTPAYFRIGGTGHSVPNIHLWVDDISVTTEREDSLSKDIRANAVAVNATNSEVERVDGLVTAANSAITSLSGRVSTVEGAVATKAEASALTALTTRVTNAEGVNTSQGSAITSIQNTINHSTTGLASKASSAALTTVDNKVTAANGRIDTTNSNLTALTGRVDTVEGAVSTKADASALTSLTTRVTNAEGVNTSQGTAITTLQNTVNHATTGLSTKASSTALTAVDNKVTAVDNRVTATNSDVTVLTGRVSTVEGTVATKADVSAMNALTTRVGNVEGGLNTQASSITSLEAGLRSAASSAFDLIPNPTFDPIYNQMGFTVVPSTDVGVPAGCPFPYVARLAARDHFIVGADNLQCKTGDVFEFSALVACGAGTADFNLYTYRRQFITSTVNQLTASGGNTKAALNGGTWKRVTWRWTVPEHDYPFFTPFLQVSQNPPWGTVWYVTDWHCINVTAADKAETTANTNASALSALTTRVTTAEGSITSQGSRVTSLENSINHATTGLATKASSAALTTLDNKVTAIDGRVTSNSSSITSLNNSLTTTNTNVTAAQTAATNAMTAAGQKGKVIFGTAVPATADRLSQNLWIDTTGNTNTPKRWNGSSWVVVTDKVATDALAAANAASSLAATKADSSALTALDSKVTNVDGKVTTNSNSITSLNSRMSAAEGNISTKADATALTDYYTKTEADTKATTIAAGEVSKYDASLVIGGTNLFANSDFSSDTSGWESAGVGAALSIVNDTEGKFKKVAQVVSPSVSQGFKSTNTSASALKLVPYDTYTMSGWVRSSVPMTLYPAIDGSGTSNALPVQADTAWKYFTITKNLTGNNIPRIYGSGEYFVADLKLEKGTKATDWTPNIAEVQESIDANASAIDTLNSEVVRVDGRVTTEANRITSLSGRVSTVEGQVATKADASALNSIYTKTETDAKAASIAAGEVNKYDAGLVIGGVNLVNRNNELNGYMVDQAGQISAYVGISTINGFIAVTAGEPLTLSKVGVAADNHFRYAFYDDADSVISRTASTDNVITLTVPNNATRFRISYPTVCEVQVERGTKATTISPSSDDVQTQLDTNASAIQSTNTEVARVDGKTTVNANNITGLTSRMGTVEGQVSTKANASALNNYYTKTEAAANATTVAAGEVSKYDAKLVVGGKNLFSNNDWKNNQIVPQPSFTSVPVAPIELLPNTTYTISTNYPARGSNPYTFDIFVTTTQTAASSTVNGVALDMPRTFTTNSTGTAYIHCRDINLNPGSPHWIQIERGNSATAYVPNQVDAYSILSHETEVNAEALSTTNTEVSRINGVVSGHTTQLSNLTASIEGKANTSALNALTVRVANEEGKSSSQASDLVSLSSSLGKSNLINKEAWKIAGNLGYIIPTGEISVLSTHVYSDFIPVSTNQLSWALTDIGSGGNTSMRIAFYKVDKTFHSIPVNGGVQTVSSATIDVPADAAYVRFSIPLVHTVEAVFKSSKVDLSGYATASALSNLDTKVVAIDGVVSTQASQLTVLTSDNNANKNALSVQGKVLDGVKANYMVKMETNGVIGGFGIIQESTGAMGTVTTTFGVNANNFFIGAPASNKKPFIVTTANQVVNGVTYPAGTYIDVALIANATIGTAKIADASITNAKILDATIESAKIKSIKADKIEIGNPLVGPITSSMVTGTSLTNAANLFNSSPVANASFATYGTGTQSATSGAETSYIQVDVGSTVSMPEVRFFFRGSTGRKTYIKLKASVDGVNWDYIMGSSSKWETIDDMPPSPGSSYGTVIVQAAFSWYGVKPYRYLRLYGNGSSASATNELVAIIGNASGTITKIGSEGILTGAITADKIQVDSLSAVSANLGTIKVGSANIADLAVNAAHISDAAITSAKIGDLEVDSIKIRDNAVSTNIEVSGASSVTITTASSSRLTISVGITTDFFAVENAYNAQLRLFRNGVAIKTFDFKHTAREIIGESPNYSYVFTCALPSVIDIVAQGTYVYSVQVLTPQDYSASRVWSAPATNTWVKLSNLTLGVMELKK